VPASSRDSDHTLPTKGLDLLGQQLGLLVAVAQPAKVSIAPAADGAVGGEGDVVRTSSRHSDDALASQGAVCGGGMQVGVAVAPSGVSLGSVVW